MDVGILGIYHKALHSCAMIIRKQQNMDIIFIIFDAEQHFHSVSMVIVSLKQRETERRRERKRERELYKHLYIDPSAQNAIMINNANWKIKHPAKIYIRFA